MKNFRIISALFSLIVMLIFAGCDNEPLEGFDLDGDNPFTNSLTGTWTLVDFNNSVNSTTEFNGMTTESNVVIDGFNPDYDLIFNTSSFTTNGSYSYNTEITINDQPPMSDSYSLNNVTGAGNYFITGNEMTIDGSFFEFTFQGMDLSQLQGEQTITFSISPDGQTLTFTQNTTETGGAGGATTTAIVTGSSVWSKVATNNTTCADASDFAAAAETAFNNDNTNVDLCNAYKSALQNQISACGDASGEIQSVIDGLGDCSDSSASIIGMWQLISETEDDVEIVLTECELLQTIEFNETEYIDNWQFSTSGNTPCQSGTNIDPYTIAANIITVDDGVEPFELEVISVNQTTLVLKSTEEFGGVINVFIETYTKL